SPLSLVGVEHVGGAMARLPHDATAFAHRGAPYNLLAIARWTEPTEADVNIRWARDLADELRPLFSGGIYVNYMDAQGEGLVQAAYGANYARLAALKAKYDPTNFFSQNQ